MKRLLIALPILFLLSACGPMPTVQPMGTSRPYGFVNPYSELADGNATVAAAQAVLQSTQDEIDRQNYQATKLVLETQGALQVQLDLLEAQAKASEQAYQMDMARAQATDVARKAMTQEAIIIQNAQETASAQAAIATSTAQAAAIQTAQAWQITQTPLAATQAAIARADRKAEQKAKWDEFLMPFKALFWPLFWLVILALMVSGSVLTYRRLMPIIDLRLRTVSRKGNDNPLVMFDNMLVDAARMFGPALRITAGGAEISGAARPDYQAEVTSRALLVDAMRALPRDGSGRQAAKTVLQKAQPVPVITDAPEAEIVATALPPVAPWRMLDDWDGKALPLGLNRSGLVLSEIEDNPHLLVTGSTSSGKTSCGLRPVITAALSAGFQVAIFARSPMGMSVFEDHPNAHIVPIDRDDPSGIMAFLAALYREAMRRQEILEAAHAYTWRPISGAEFRIMTVIDEFSNLVDALPASGRGGLWARVRALVSEGRKGGVHLALAMQDGTARSIDLPTRRNTTPMVFRTGDDSASLAVLETAGAERLEKRQFIAKLAGGLVRGVAFQPADSDIRNFLDAHRVEALPAPAWLLEADRQVSRADTQNEGDQTERIREMHASGASMRQIETAIFGYTGGKANETVKAVIGRATTTTDMPATGVVDVVAL